MCGIRNCRSHKNQMQPKGAVAAALTTECAPAQVAQEGVGSALEQLLERRRAPRSSPKMDYYQECCSRLWDIVDHIPHHTVICGHIRRTDTHAHKPTNKQTNKHTSACTRADNHLQTCRNHNWCAFYSLQYESRQQSLQHDSGDGIINLRSHTLTCPGHMLRGRPYARVPRMGGPPSKGAPCPHIRTQGTGGAVQGQGVLRGRSRGRHRSGAETVQREDAGVQVDGPRLCTRGMGARCARA
jgi:hypothetical protein